MKKLISVFGSTGAQGGSVVEALLRRPDKFAVRCCTRKVNSPKALEYQERGCEIVPASYDDPSSLNKAMKGAHGAWFITSFWDSGKGTVDAEVALGGNVAKAAKQNNLEHLIYSTLESPAVMQGQQFPTFDAKVGVEQEILYAGVPFTFVQVAYYYNNLENNNPNPHAAWYPWQKNEKEEWVIEIPIGTLGLHGIHNEDTGECFGNIFENPKQYLAKKVALSGELLTGESIVHAFRKTFPDDQFVFKNPSLEDYAKTAPVGFGDALLRMYGWYQFRMPKGGDIPLTRRLNPDTLRFEAYLAKYKNRFKGFKGSKTFGPVVY